MKYEAKIKGNNNGAQTYSESFIPESRASGTPWVMINQTQAIAECQSLGSGYHLITNAEWTALARHIAAQPSNWSTGTVGDGVLSRGYSASATLASDGFTNTVPAPTTGTANDVYNVDADLLGSSGNFSLKRVYNFANGKTVWDISGNVWEWNSDTCNPGTGAGYWYNSNAWIEWNDSNLSDYEIEMSGPNPLYTATHNAGRYYGCTASGNVLFSGGGWYNGLRAGIFTKSMNYSPSGIMHYIGFRCTK